MKRWLTDFSARPGFTIGMIVAATAFALMGQVPKSYPLTCTAISNVALSTTSEEVIASTVLPKKFCISNRDTAIKIYVAFHATATSADVEVGPGQTLCEEASGTGHVYQGVVDALAASGTPAIGGWTCK